MHHHANSKPGSASPSPALDPWLLWVAFRKNWAWVIPAGALLASIGGWAVWNTFVPEYQATHMLEVNRDYVISPSAGNVSNDWASSERPLITNAIVLDKVLADESLRKAPSLADPSEAERQIRARLSVSNAGTTNLLTISYLDTDPEMAAVVCNAVAEAYLGLRAKFDNQRMGNVESWLAEPIEKWKGKVQELRRNLTELTKLAKGYDPFKENSTLITENWRISTARSSLASLEAEETVLMAQLQVLESSEVAEVKSDSDLNPEMVRNLVDSDVRVQKLRGALRDVEEKIRQLEYKELHNLWADRYKTMREDAARIRRELTELETEVGEQALGVVAKAETRKVSSSHAQSIRDLNLKLQGLRAEKDAFRSEYEMEKANLEKLGGETADIFFAREDYQQAAEILGLLNNRLAILRTERGRGSSISTMAPAKAPLWPVEEVPFKKIGVTALGAFLVPFALAILLEFRFKRLTDPNSLEQNNLAPVMGEIARIPAGGKSSRGHRLFEESVDALRANLLYKLQGVRSIAVTSAMSGEGKSSVASQLAISLGRTANSTVLLIDADLRSPDQHDLFGLSNDQGLCKCLANEAAVEMCIDRSLGDLLHVLPAGRLSTNPHNLLTTENMKNLLDQLSATYRYIVVDTSPVLPAAESLAVAATCDATLFCAMRDVSRVEHMQRTLRRLEASGANVIGTVFSGVPAREYAYRYGDYHYAKDKLENSQAV